MDVFAKDNDLARKQILEVLTKMKGVRDLQPTSVTINAFFDAKAQELANIYSRGDEEVRAQAVEILLQMDPTNSNLYRKAVK